MRKGPRTAVLLLLLSATLAACLPDEPSGDKERFDIQALTPQHQDAFRDAMADLNALHGSHLAEDPDGPSAAYYGEPNPGKTATAFCSSSACDVVFDNNKSWETSLYKSLYFISRHELCHVIGFHHHNGNPQHGHC